jgi:lysophospholipase L1-like esterase
MKKPQLLRKAGFLVALSSLLFSSSPLALAQTEAFFDFINEDVNLVNSNNEWTPINDGFGDVRCGVSPQAGNVYIIGDSITEFAKEELNTQISGGGWDVYIDAEIGRPLRDNSVQQSLDSNDQNARRMADSVAVVIALGTNNGNSEADFKDSIDANVELIQETAPEADIYWVDIAVNVNNEEIQRANYKNNAIYDSFSSGRIISWHKAVFGDSADPTNAPNDLAEETDYLVDDGVHPNTAGQVKFAELIDAKVRAGTAPAQSDPSGGGLFSPLTLRYPNFTNENEIADALTSYINDWTSGSSPWLEAGGGQGVGRWLFSEARDRDINPLLFAAIGRQENGFGRTDGGWSQPRQVTQGFNYFGMKDFGQSDPRIVSNGGNDYLFFANREAGMTYFMDVLERNITGEGSQLYLGVENIYDYVSVHQVGQIVYPGEPFGTDGPTGEDLLDPTMGVYISWTTTDHPRDIYDGQLFNPGIYYSNTIDFINAVTGLNLSNIPVRGSNGSGDCIGAGGLPGNISPDGYAFPLEPQTQGVSGIYVGQTTSEHWDGSDAFDLFSPLGTEAGADVYAIYDGTPVTINTSFKDVAGCTSIQFYADDGYYYWYGHLKNPVVEEGKHITVGTQMAEVADSSFTTNCTGGGGPHLHIDRGCTPPGGTPQRGGTKGCRDPEFIPFLSTIYENLPPA